MTDAALTRSREAAGRSLSTTLGRFRTAEAGWPLGVGVICFTLTAARLSTGVDTFLDLVCGRLIVGHGLPRVDVVSVIGHGREWIDQQWLAQVIMYGVWRAFGSAGIGLLLALLLAVAYALLARLCVQFGSPPQRALCWALLAFLGALGYVSIRSEMFSYPAFVLVLTLLAEDSRRDRPARSFLWLFCVLALWANLHGAVVLGVALAVLYGAVRAGLEMRRRVFRRAFLYVGSAVASFLCLFATPYGLSEAHYYRSVFSSAVLPRYENEWTSPRLMYPFNWMTFVFVIAVVAVGVLAAHRRYLPNPVLALAAAVTGALAFDAVRYQPWFSISAAAVVAATLGALRPAPPALSPRFVRLGATALAVIAVVVAVSAARTSVARNENGLRDGALAAAARWSAAHPRANILADVSTSDRLLWWYPATIGRVGMDGRLDFYEPADVRRWFGYVLGSRVPSSIGGSSFEVYVATKRSRLLYRKLLEAPCLRTLHADAFAIAVVRDRSKTSCTAAAGK